MAAMPAKAPRIHRDWLALGLLACGLAACGTPQPAVDSAAPGQPVAAVDPATARDAAEPAPTGGDGGRLPAPATPEVALAVPSAGLAGPERLMRLSGDELKALLGSPGFVRRDPPAEIWQYGTASCVLDVFLYAEAKGGPHRVSHFEFRGRSVEGVAPADCYRQLLAARARVPSG